MASLLKWVSSSLLSTTNRGLMLQVPSVLNNQVSGYANASKINKIVQKLGIAEPPKKPQNAYIRFQQENRESLQKVSKSQRDLVALAAQQWQQLSGDEKLKYISEFKKENAVYQKLHKEYVDKLTPEQKKAIKLERASLREAAQKRSLKNEKKSAGKPKKPANPFVLFIAEKTKGSNLNAKGVKGEWAQLGDDQKQAYKLKAQQLLDAYEDELKAWEDKMMVEGKAHLIRKARFVTKKADKLKRASKPNTE